MKKIILILMLYMAQLTNSAQAIELSPQQKEVQRIAKAVGNINCIDGFCFTEILQAIAWQESSYGNNLVGDSKNTVYYFKHRDAILEVQKENIFIEDGLRYTMYKPIKNEYRKRVYTKTKWKPLSDSSIGAFQIKLSTAQEVIERMKLKQYYYLLSNEQLLVSKLLTDTNFSATIAVNFLKMQYISALANGHVNPSHRAISRYNGGNENTTYINIILKKVKEL